VKEQTARVTESVSALVEASPPTSEDGRTRPTSKLVSFSDVVRAHYEWDAAAREGDAEKTRIARRRFSEKLVAFEDRFEVDLVDAYWCRKEASAVALVETRKRESGALRRAFRRVFRVSEAPDFRLFRVTDWVTGDTRKLADALHKCDVLAIKATWGLEGFQRTVVMQWLLAVEVHVLGFIESEWQHARGLAGTPGSTGIELGSDSDETDAPEAKSDRRRSPGRRATDTAAARLEHAYRGTLRELNKVEDYYLQAGQKRARLRYVEGMFLIGIPAVALAAVVAGAILAIFGLFDPDAPGVRRFYACMAAGAFGAIVSVLMRMAGHRGGFTIDHELGAVGVMRLGSFRPFIGAVSGVVLSFLIQTPFLQLDEQSFDIELFVVVAFLAGFSERWTKVVLDGAMRTIDDGGDPAPQGKAHAGKAETA
jgi:RsiW-degrading membrane proteinase PrsW (M82 family)